MRMSILLLATIALLAGCEDEPTTVIVQPEPSAIPTPADCVPSKIFTDNECHEIASGRITIPECCGRKP